jgi:hypothetical protein
MRDLDKLVQVQRAIDTLTSGENNLAKLGVSSIEEQVGSVSDDLDVSRIANIQNVVRNTTGANLDLGGIFNAADCLKNIDDLLIERVKQKAVDMLLETESAQEMLQKMGDISDIAKQAGNVIRQANELKEKSLAELVVDARNAGLLDRIGIIKKINDQFGDVVGNLNDIIANIATFDICSMTNYQSGVALPPSAKISPGTPTPLPKFKPLMNIDQNLIDTQDRFNDHTFRIKDIIGKTELEQTPSSRSMLTALQDFYYIGQRKAYSGLGDGFNDEMNREIQRTLDAKRDEWSGEILNEFKARSEGVISQIAEDAPILSQYNKMRTLEPGEEDIDRGIISTGIGIYGTPDWDWTRFLSIIPEERPDYLVKYWEDLGYVIQDGEEEMKAAGMKPGVLKFEYSTKGTYERPLFSGYAIASTKFRGGTRFLLQNQDGTPYDPAGLNPSGIVTVVDTGDPAQTFDTPYLFVDKAAAASYTSNGLSSVSVILLENGSDENAEYLAAQKQRSST